MKKIVKTIKTFPHPSSNLKFLSWLYRWRILQSWMMHKTQHATNWILSIISYCHIFILDWIFHFPRPRMITLNNFQFTSILSLSEQFNSILKSLVQHGAIFRLICYFIITRNYHCSNKYSQLMGLCWTNGLRNYGNKNLLRWSYNITSKVVLKKLWIEDNRG